MPANAPRIQMLLTGDELMSGDTVDSNSAMIARDLNGIGLQPLRRVTLGDEPEALGNELRELCANSDALLVNGGLGPTIDDLTAGILAQVSGQPLAEHPKAFAHLDEWCSRRGLALNQANRKQAQLPANCDIIANPVGSAVGIAMEINGCLVLCSPGVPGELRAMLPEMMQRLQQRFGITVQRDVLRLQTFGIGESTVQQMVIDQYPNWPEEVALSFRAGAPQLELKLSVNDAQHLPLRDACRAKLECLFGDHIIGEADSKLAGALIRAARAAGKTISCAESCTGGMIASMITQIPGSSEVFPGGFVTYSNALKHQVLGVSQQTLESHGAVSEHTVREMVSGALRISGSDLAVAVSGIAGPGGGSDEKPVGTVWLAWGDASNMNSACLCWPVERSLFQTMVAAAAIDVLRRQIMGLEKEAQYFYQRRARSS